MCKPNIWELPGGITEPGESPAEGLMREMVEEMGWGPSPTGVLVIDWLRPYLGWEDAVELVFATEIVRPEDAARLTPDGHEILALHWACEDELDAHMTPFGADRVRSALEAAARGVTLYTEAGRPRRTDLR